MADSKETKDILRKGCEATAALNVGIDVVNLVDALGQAGADKLIKDAVLKSKHRVRLNRKVLLAALGGVAPAG
jgi:hypothetical protein